jgi:hypothetical protein
MWTDSGPASRVGTPRAEGLAQFAEHAFQVGDFLFQELADVDARGRSCPPQSYDTGDLSESQANPRRATHEGQQAEDVNGVGAIAGCRAVGRREDASRLVEPQRLTAQSAPGRNLTNEEPVLHGGKIGPALRGKVKSETSWPISARDHTPNTRTSPASAHAPRPAGPRIWSVALKRHAPQSQCVADDRHRAQAHAALAMIGLNSSPNTG